MDLLYQREFWRIVSSLVEPDGRIDILACDLAASDQGKMLVATLEDTAGVNVAASSDKTGNVTAGGDWVLETDNIDVASAYFSDEKICSAPALRPLW